MKIGYNSLVLVNKNNPVKINIDSVEKSNLSW